jgi:putative membrane protein
VTVGIVVCAWAVEYVGHSTGLLFGRYAYTSLLQPQLGGVPLLIPLAWLTMLPPAWAVARRITRGRVTFVLVSALAFTAWDLLLDPQMVAWNLWIWEQPGGYFGIPWTNFAGWLVASAAITALADRVAPLGDLPERPLIAIYAMTWALEMAGLLLFWGLPAPALVGGAAMGLMLLVSLRSGADFRG